MNTLHIGLLLSVCLLILHCPIRIFASSSSDDICANTKPEQMRASVKMVFLLQSCNFCKLKFCLSEFVFRCSISKEQTITILDDQQNIAYANVTVGSLDDEVNLSGQLFDANGDLRSEYEGYPISLLESGHRKSVPSTNGDYTVLELASFPTCLPNYYGKTCAKCCHSQTGIFSCNERGDKVCNKNYILIKDQCVLDACLVNKCPDKVSCTNHNGSYICNCLTHHKDSHCQYNACSEARNVCYNGGTCSNIDKGKMFKCTCSPGFTGPDCSIPVTPQPHVAIIPSVITVDRKTDEKSQYHSGLKPETTIIGITMTGMVGIGMFCGIFVIFSIITCFVFKHQQDKSETFCISHPSQGDANGNVPTFKRCVSFDPNGRLVTEVTPSNGNNTTVTQSDLGGSINMASCAPNTEFDQLSSFMTSSYNQSIPNNHPYGNYNTPGSYRPLTPGMDATTGVYPNCEVFSNHMVLRASSPACSEMMCPRDAPSAFCTISRYHQDPHFVCRNEMDESGSSLNPCSKCQSLIQATATNSAQFRHTRNGCNETNQFSVKLAPNEAMV